MENAHLEYLNRFVDSVIDDVNTRFVLCHHTNNCLNSKFMRMGRSNLFKDQAATHIQPGYSTGNRELNPIIDRRRQLKLSKLDVWEFD